MTRDMWTSSVVKIQYIQGEHFLEIESTELIPSEWTINSICLKP